MAANDFETTDVNLELETKVGNKMEYAVLAKASIIESHRKLCNYEKETVECRLTSLYILVCVAINLEHQRD